MRRIALFLVCFLKFSLSAPIALAEKLSEKLAADNPYEKFNPNSVNPIPESHILIRKRIWREIYLKEKQNKPFFTRNREITKIIIDGVKQGLLTPYKDEAFAKEMTKEEFFENLKIPGDDSPHTEEKALGFTDDDGWGSSKKGISVDGPSDYFLPNEVSILEVMEDWIFDKVRSEQVYDIQSFKLTIPEDKFETGLRREVGLFKYKDLATYFDSIPEEAVWVNTNNNAFNLKLTEAFALRAFSSRLIKLENPDDATLEDIYNKTPQEALIAAKRLEEKLLEDSYFLWEY